METRKTNSATPAYPHSKGIEESKEAVSLNAAVDTRPFIPISDQYATAFALAAYFDLTLLCTAANIFSLRIPATVGLTLPVDSKIVTPTSIADMKNKRKADLALGAPDNTSRKRLSTAACFASLATPSLPVTPRPPTPTIAPAMPADDIVISPDPSACPEDLFLRQLYFQNTSLPGKCFGIEKKAGKRTYTGAFDIKDCTNLISNRL